MMKSYLLICILCAVWIDAIALPTTSLDCTNKPADVVFVLDSSNSIWRQDFRKQINFVNDVINQFDIGSGPRQTNVGVLTFGHVVWKKFDLKDKVDPKKLTKAVKAIRHGGGRWTNTGDAIKFAVNEMFTKEAGSRTGVAKVIIVITDGRSQNTQKTTDAAKLAHENDIKVFAVGVGRDIDFEELKAIASDPDEEYLFMVDDFNLLDTIRVKLAKKACDDVTLAPPAPVTTIAPTTPQPADQSKKYCGGKPADVFFLVDASGSISHKNFNKELEFVRNVVEVFDVGVETTRVGVIVFSSSSKKVISLNNTFEKSELLNNIGEIKHIGGGTNTADALRMVRQDGFARDIVRDNVTRIAIVLTDGLSSSEELTRKEAELTQAAGINVFAIGIGDGFDLIEIQNIASNPHDNYVYQVGDFNSLDSIKEALTIKACSQKPSEVKQKDQPECRVKQTTDLMFIYDTANLGPEKTAIISEFMTEVVSGLDLASGLLHVGRVTDNCPSGGNFQLSDKLSAADFKSIQFYSYSNLIKNVRRVGFSSEYGGRDGASNATVLFLDSDMSGLDDQVLEEAKLLDSSSEMFVISIGTGPIIDEFEASLSGSNYLHVDSFEELRNSARKFLTKLCFYFVVDSTDYDIGYVVPV